MSEDKQLNDQNTSDYWTDLGINSSVSNEDNREFMCLSMDRVNDV